MMLHIYSYRKSELCRKIVCGQDGKMYEDHGKTTKINESPQ